MLGSGEPCSRGSTGSGEGTAHSTYVRNTDLGGSGVVLTDARPGGAKLHATQIPAAAAAASL